jgi:uncharacterized protein YeaO (DUF488 family)
MLTRQKVLLALIGMAGSSLSSAKLGILAFLFRHETESGREMTFYDFVPCKHGPFSFSLFHELNNLRRDGYLTLDEDRIALCERAITLVDERLGELPIEVRDSLHELFRHCGRKSQEELLTDVSSRYPWFASRREPSTLRPANITYPKLAKPAVFTTGYEGKSVDAFFNHLLEQGIRLIIDVRANPASRHYGFSKKQLTEIAKDLGIDYKHVPELGIPSKFRSDITDFESHQRLMMKYEEEILPQHDAEVDQVGSLMQRLPAALMCMEKDVEYCHRSRLAKAVASRTGLEVRHI